MEVYDADPPSLTLETPHGRLVVTLTNAHTSEPTCDVRADALTLLPLLGRNRIRARGSVYFTWPALELIREGTGVIALTERVRSLEHVTAAFEEQVQAAVLAERDRIRRELEPDAISFGLALDATVARERCDRLARELAHARAHLESIEVALAEHEKKRSTQAP